MKYIFGGKITLDNADEDQRNSLIEIVEFNKDTKQKVELYEGREMVINVFKCEIFPLAPIEGTGHPSDLGSGLKVLTTKQMLQRLPIALAEVKTSNTSKNFK